MAKPKRSIPLPANFPTPRYNFGQQVEWAWWDNQTNTTYHELGTIDGMWLDYSEDSQKPTWVYMVNLHHDSDTFELCDVTGMSVSESEIVAYKLESLLTK